MIFTYKYHLRTNAAKVYFYEIYEIVKLTEAESKIVVTRILGAASVPF